jgi:hypothetical protein
MTFERSTDYALIRSIMTHPDVWDAISDDHCPAVEVWSPVESELAMYMVVRDGSEVLGLWMLVPESAIVVQIHTCLLPTCGVTRGRQAAKEMARWIWTNTPFVRIVTSVPEFNRAASIFAIAAGMKPYGNNPQSYEKGGILWDQHLMGMSRPSVEAVAA